MFGSKISKDKPYFHECIVCRFCRNFTNCREFEDLEYCNIPLDGDHCLECPKQYGERCAGYVSLFDKG